MDDVCRVEELKCSKNLIDEVLNVLSEQLLPRANNSTQVGFHEFAYKIDVA